MIVENKNVTCESNAVSVDLYCRVVRLERYIAGSQFSMQRYLHVLL